MNFILVIAIASAIYLFNKYRNVLWKSISKYVTSEFEGAGFTFIYKDSVILVTRLKKQKDLEKDSTKEVEYVGGKVEADEEPYDTAFAELVEELGGNPLEDDWPERAIPISTWQPFSKKWIWNYVLILNDAEFENLKNLDIALDHWGADEMKDFREITDRTETSRKAVEAVCAVNKYDFLDYVAHFSVYGDRKNRMKDAKAYGNDENTKLFTVTRISNADETHSRRLRGFNLVIIEQHFDFFNALLNTSEREDVSDSDNQEFQPEEGEESSEE